MIKIYKILLLCLFINTINCNAQEDLLAELEEEAAEENLPVEFHFKSQYLINSQTTELVNKGDMDFRITHRFGNVGGASGGYETLWGIDNATNIRFSFDYGVTDYLQIGVGRSNTNQHLDGNIKVKLLQQHQRKIPVSLVYFTNMAYTPMKDRMNIYDDAAQRMSFTHQLVFSRKFANKVSIGILPTVIHRNLVIIPQNSTLEDQNTLFSLGTSLRWMVTNRVSLIAEYFYTFSEVRQKSSYLTYYNPLAIGVEIETGGHVFHINITNTAGIITNDFIPNSSDSWLDNGFKLGFTISRNFKINN